MNIIIDRPQLVRVVLRYLNMNFGNLTPKTSSRYPNSIFYVDSDEKVLMEYEKENKDFYISHPHLWKKINSLFLIGMFDTEQILEHWLINAYHIEKSSLPPIPTERRSRWNYVNNLSNTN